MAEPVPRLWAVPDPAPLPGHQALLGVDMEKYSAVPSRKQGAVSTLVPELVNDALEIAGLDELRAEPRFAAFPGDGYVFGFDPQYLPRLLTLFLGALDGVLKDYNARSAGLRCRLRAGVHLGPLPYSGAPSDGNGDARITLHRLLDCDQLKQVLARADRDGTALVAIVSDQVYCDVVRAGYSTLHPSCYVRILATVPGKQFAEPAWIYVPSPSGALLEGIVDNPSDPGGGPRLQRPAESAVSTLDRLLESSRRIRITLDSGHTAEGV